MSFFDWSKRYSTNNLRADILAGLTVALVLIPQSMAYAELAGLPPYYGLYASFLPPMVAALFGSSRQLATGPVAVVSLLTSTTLEPLATAGSQEYIAYAILLALLVGAFQLSLGVLRLGLVVNFISHPVVNGFSNAAALIMLGASGVQIGKYIMQAAAGCLGSESDRCNICNIGLCPKGITSQDPRLYRRLDVEQVAQRVVDLFLSFDTELKKIVAPLGRSTSLPIGMSDALGIDDHNAAERLQIKYVV